MIGLIYNGNLYCLNCLGIAVTLNILKLIYVYLVSILYLRYLNGDNIITLIKQYIDKYGGIDVGAMKAIAFMNVFVRDYIHLLRLKDEKEIK